MTSDLDQLIEDETPALLKSFDDAIEDGEISGLTADELETLMHELLARRLVEALRDPARCTPGILQVVRGFLRDNEITGLDIPGSAQSNLREAMQARAPFPIRIAEG